MPYGLPIHRHLYALSACQYALYCLRLHHFNYRVSGRLWVVNPPKMEATPYECDGNVM